MTTLLFDDFLYRWYEQGGVWYYGSASGSGHIPFSYKERSHLLSRFLNGLLTHDQIYIRIAQLEELISLLGIAATLFLLKADTLVVIDDGGTFAGFMPNGDDNLLMNFSSATALQFDAILSRLQKEHIGFTQRNLLKSLIYQADGKKLEADGALLQQQVSLEDSSDLRNGILTKFLEFGQSYDNIIVKEDDIVPLMRLNQANKSLIYQHEFKITTLSTEKRTQHIIAAKLGPYLGGRRTDPIELFEDILHKKQLPDLSGLYQQGRLTMIDILKLRDNYDGRKFRQWLESEDYDQQRIYQQLLKSRKSLSSIAWQSLIRWIIPTVVGILHTPVGVAVSALDNFLVSYLMKDWHPNLFLDGQLTKKLDDIAASQKMQIAHKQQLEIWNRRIGRNDPCPCHSGLKFKHCCGKGVN
ncbi:YecA family protein [Pedobacter sp. Leaf132]|uniref:YecA family protein n=1 Tax=Pedobacter sp. Leaf132 TaxID=2876557 RepID=UPI001E4E0082|nr:SEC-C metal-binding domain-containing protein [Pedobacter sp. Leaf132]